MWTVLLAGAALAAGGAQLRMDVVKGEQSWSFSYAWRDAADHRQEVAFELPAAPLLADREEQTWLPRHQLYEDVAKQLRAWGKGLKGVTLTVTVADQELKLAAKGTGDVRGALREAEDVRDAAIDAWLGEHEFTRLEDGSLSFDHARLVDDYASELAPVAAALRAGTDGDRAFVDRALSFVQAIPYEARKKKGGDPGYRRPLALLVRDRGDCDSKTVLFLALLRAELTDLPMAVIYLPDHALGAVALDREKGDRSFKDGGVRYLYVEPVGPAVLPVGQVGDGHERAGKKGEVRPVAPGAVP